MTSRWLLVCGVIAGPLFTLGYVIVFVGIAAWWFHRKDILS